MHAISLLARRDADGPSGHRVQRVIGGPTISLPYVPAMAARAGGSTGTAAGGIESLPAAWILGSVEPAVSTDAPRPHYGHAG